MFEQRKQQATLTSEGRRSFLIAGYDFWLVCCLFLIITIGLIIAVASATQDITVDALRIEQIGVNEGSSMPVSYTHLTLPTICSV